MFLNTEIHYAESRMLAFVTVIVIGFTVWTRTGRHWNNNDPIIDILIIARSSAFSRLLFYKLVAPFKGASARFLPDYISRLYKIKR